MEEAHVPPEISGRVRSREQTSCLVRVSRALGAMEGALTNEARSHGNCMRKVIDLGTVPGLQREVFVPEGARNARHPTLRMRCD